MRYQGGKHRLARRIAERVARERRGRRYVEPFLGGASVAAAVGGKGALLSDVRVCVVAMWRAAASGWGPPAVVTEDEYHRIREAGDEENPLYAFAGIGCSWGGRLWGGYARALGRDCAGEARRSVLRKGPRLAGAEFRAGGFDEWGAPPPGSVVYCDPPYVGTTGYGTAFDTGRFWAWVKSCPSSSRVLVSESSAPPWAEGEMLCRVSPTRVTKGREEWLYASPEA